MSSSLAVSWLPNGALGCEDGRAAAVCGLCGGASGDGALCWGARFFSNAANCPGSYFFCSICGSFLTICRGGSGFSLGFGASAVGAGFGSGNRVASAGGGGAAAEEGGTGAGFGGSGFGSGFATGVSCSGISGL